MILTTVHRLKRKSGLGRPLQNSCEAPCNWSSVWPLAEPSETQYWLLACLLYQQERNSLGWSVWVLAANLPGLPSTIYLENAPQGLRERWHPFSEIRDVYIHSISVQSLIFWWPDIWPMMATKLILLLNEWLWFLCWSSLIYLTLIYIWSSCFL